MAPDKDYLSSLGLEIAKRKYYNAAKVESVIEDFRRHAAALDEENAALRARVESLSYGKEEIGDAILSAKAIAQQLLAEAREEADKLVSGARDEAERLVSEAREEADSLADAAEDKADRLITEARENAARLVSEAEEKRAALLAACERDEQAAIRRAEETYLLLRGQYASAIDALDRNWQRFLCSLGEEGTAKEAPPLPEELAERLGKIAQSLDEIRLDDEDEKPEGM